LRCATVNAVPAAAVAVLDPSAIWINRRGLPSQLNDVRVRQEHVAGLLDETQLAP
jgi:hypothetical protein